MLAPAQGRRLSCKLKFSEAMGIIELWVKEIRHFYADAKSYVQILQTIELDSDPIICKMKKIISRQNRTNFLLVLFGENWIMDE